MIVIWNLHSIFSLLTEISLNSLNAKKGEREIRKLKTRQNKTYSYSLFPDWFCDETHIASFHVYLGHL